MTTPFHRLESFLDLPRITGLTAAADASRVVATVSTLDRERARWVSAIWALDPDGEDPPRRLTRGADGELGAVFTPEGDLIFSATRPGADADAPAALWLLPRTAGEPRLLVRAPGGFAQVRVAADSGTVLAGIGVLPSANGLAEDATARTRRTEDGVDAILHEGYPVRFWDADLGPDSPRLFRAELPSAAATAEVRDEQVELLPITGGVGAALYPDAHWRISPDGAWVVTDWAAPQPGADTYFDVVRIDVASGVRVVLAAGSQEWEYTLLALSPRADLVALKRWRRSTPTLAPSVDLCVVPLGGGEIRCLTEGFEHWPTEAVFSADAATVYFCADDGGRAPVFAVPVDGSAPPRRLTGDGAFLQLTACTDGSLFALRTTYTEPGRPVRLHPQPDGSVRVAELASPAPAPALPGTLRELTTAVATDHGDTTVRGFLALPEGVSSAHPAPLLLWVHGGPLSSWNSWSWRWCPWLLVAQGYAVLLPDPALSTGYGEKFIQRGWGAWGEAPYTDLMAITDAAEALPEIDRTRTAAMGGSFGGYMANWIAGHTDRFSCIVSHASLWALDQFSATTDVANYWHQEMTAQMSLQNSPHRFVESITSPMLVIHGDRDYRVPIGEALRLWYDLLAAHSGPQGSSHHKFLYFPTENHWVLSPGNVKVWYETVFAFLATHVLGQEWHRPASLG